MGRMLRNFAGMPGTTGARRMFGLEYEKEEQKSLERSREPSEPSEDSGGRAEPLLRNCDQEASGSSGSSVVGSEGRERSLVVRLVDERNLLEESGDNCKGTLGAWMDDRLSAMSLGLIDLLPGGAATALESPTAPALSYEGLKQFLASTDLLSTLGVGPGARIAVCVQNGASLATCILATINLGCCCPLDPNSPEAELVRDFNLLHVEAVLVDAPSSSGARAAQELGLACALLVPDESLSAGVFSLRSMAEGKSPSPRASRKDDDTVLVLSTSGTTGRKKTVPYTLRTLATGAGCIVKSWNLQPEDCCLNMMPLIHIGGIARNLLGTLLSGGKLVCYPFFDPVAFWSGIEEREVTWYYGSPAMHRSIIEEGKQRPGRPVHLRMVCNAAGGLPPALCSELHDRFKCSVLPSYGMSECMPITSPPPDFDDRAPTTSGLPCGPEISIISEQGAELAAGEVGNIAVRGPPVFAGYERKEDNDSAWVNGWFITGDLGYLSQAGWLYVTGRTKEVIKRGGETVSPVEIEEAVRSHKDVVEVAAFGIKDSALGENIALAVVLKSGPRIGLPRLRHYLKEVLRPALLPQALVYCTELPKTSTGKIRRAWLSAACKAITINQDTPWRDRVFLAELSGAPLQSAEDIRICSMTFDSSLGDQALQPAFLQTRSAPVQEGKLRVTYGVGEANMAKINELLAVLDDFDKPDAVVQLAELPSGAKLPQPTPHDFLYQLDYEPLSTKEEFGVAQIWADILGNDASALSATSDFFEVGGTSLLAGRVSAELRKKFGTSLPTHVVFSLTRLRDLAAAIADCQAPSASDGKLGDSETAFYAEDASSPALSSTAPHVLLLQLLPLVLLPALRGSMTYFSFLFAFNTLCTSPRSPLSTGFDGRLDLATARALSWYLALAVMPFVARVILPLFGILAKWVLLGRVRAGRHPVFGQMYLRWWLAQQIMSYVGRGMFTMNPAMIRLHLRLLGASVSGTASVKLSSSHFVEGDLLTIEDGAQLDHPSLNCAKLDGGCLVLGPVIVERHVSVCSHTVLPPGVIVPAGASLGLWSSAHELQDSDDEHRRFNRLTYPAPHWLLTTFVGHPLLILAKLIKILPWLMMLQFVVTGLQWTSDDDTWLHKAVLSMTEPHRIVMWFVAAMIRDTMSPVIYIAVAIVLKWLVVGRFVEGLREDSEWEKFRYWFMDELISHDDVCHFAKIAGAHYYPMTIFYRLMGAKVGERIFWPGTPLHISGPGYDLLEVGDNVTFGSRTQINCHDRHEARKVRICSGAMVADNCCLLPGTTLGENGLLGSGSVGAGDYAPNSISIGCIQGSAVQLMTGAAPQEDLKPYGRAMYEGKATYLVLGWRSILCINVLSRALWAPFQSVKGWSALLVLRFMHLSWGGLSIVKTLPYILFAYVVLHLGIMLLTVTLDVALKWALIGRRKPGVYPWDTSSYCQRWKLYSSLHSCLYGGDSTLHMMGGSWWMVLYYRCLGSDIGRDVCLYPWGASPSMTEPDLVTLGDRVCVSNASLVAHTNSMGRYQLFTLRVGDDCTLQDRCRLMAGAEMLSNSTLLEHSLVMSGDVVPQNTAWQGWPNRWQGRVRSTPAATIQYASGSRFPVKGSSDDNV
mmetsp:Transcript_80847/g.212237  ORF Transcript_80847/g.212237 Transcript_80847/m.212237 type:complete len:1604 (-) Transcript_80847:21-4832(-)